MFSIIAAVGKNRELGKKGDLIFHIKEDMKFFKETTSGHTVVMGTKTWQSLPKKLPNRKNIVLTRDLSYTVKDATVVHSVEEALEAVNNIVDAMLK